MWLEVRVGFEPTNRGFADLSLNHLGTAPRVRAGKVALLAPLVKAESHDFVTPKQSAPPGFPVGRSVFEIRVP